MKVTAVKLNVELFLADEVKCSKKMLAAVQAAVVKTLNDMPVQKTHVKEVQAYVLSHD